MAAGGGRKPPSTLAVACGEGLQVTSCHDFSLCIDPRKGSVLRLWVGVEVGVVPSLSPTKPTWEERITVDPEVSHSFCSVAPSAATRQPTSSTHKWGDRLGRRLRSFSFHKASFQQEPTCLLMPSAGHPWNEPWPPCPAPPGAQDIKSPLQTSVCPKKQRWILIWGE